jgi:hypothetical protein
VRRGFAIASVALGLAGCGETTLAVELSGLDGTASLHLTLYSGCRTVTDQVFENARLPGVVVFRLPQEKNRLVVVASARGMGGAGRTTLEPGSRTTLPIVLGDPEGDLDGDGQPESVDDCGEVPPVCNFQRAELVAGQRTGTASMSPLDGQGAAAGFNQPFSSAIHPSGDILIGDMENYAVRRIDAAGNVSTWIGLAQYYGRHFQMQLAPTGDLYEASDDRIVKIATSDGSIGTFAGRSSPTEVLEGGLGDVTFDRALGLTMLYPKLMFVSEWSGGGRIRKIDLATGQVTVLSGDGHTVGYRDDEAMPLLAQYRNPQGLATDGSYLYIADEDNNCIRRVAIDSGATSTWAGRCETGYPGAENGDRSVAKFTHPVCVVYRKGTFYISDLSGVRTVRGDQVGDITAARTEGRGGEIVFPGCVSFRDDCEMIVPDYGGNRVFRVVP